MDHDTVRMLERLPDDLGARGWAFVRWDSQPYSTMDATWYIVAYARPYEPGIDDDRFISVTNDGDVYVSTDQTHSPSWEQAYRDAVEAMRTIDARRRAPRPGSEDAP